MFSINSTSWERQLTVAASQGRNHLAIIDGPLSISLQLNLARHNLIRHPISCCRTHLKHGSLIYICLIPIFVTVLTSPLSCQIPRIRGVLRGVLGLYIAICIVSDNLLKVFARFQIYHGLFPVRHTTHVRIPLIFGFNTQLSQNLQYTMVNFSFFCISSEAPWARLLRYVLSGCHKSCRMFQVLSSVEVIVLDCGKTWFSLFASD